MRVLITASGGGHTGYAVSLAQRLYGRAELLFIISSGDSWTRSKVERYGEVVEVPKPRGPRDSFIKLLLHIPRAFFKSIGSVPKDFDVFISSGSNHSVPPAIVAWLKGLRIYNIESSVRFTRPSLSARWLRPFSYVTVLQWEEQKKIHSSGKVYGPLYELPEYEPINKGYILVTGGTYGHRLLFDAVSKLELDNVVLQTGRVDPEPYVKNHPEWIIFRFDPDFSKWLAGAEVVITHFGKTAIDSVLSYRKPTIIVLNPEWRYTVGEKDAEILAKKLNAVLLKQITPSNIIQAIEEVKKRKLPTYPDGAMKLADEILKQ